MNTKGGVGKSTLAVHLAVWLSDRGFRVVLIDADDQRTASKWLGRLLGHSATVNTLSSPEENGRADELRAKIHEFSPTRDFIIVDTKGSSALSTSTAVIKSDLVLVPLQASASDIWPIEKALSVIHLSKEARGGKPQAKFVLNLTDDRDTARNRTVVTRLTDHRGRAAGRPLAELFEELLADCLTAVTRRAGNE